MTNGRIAERLPRVRQSGHATRGNLAKTAKRLAAALMQWRRRRHDRRLVDGLDRRALDDLGLDPEGDDRDLLAAYWRRWR